MAISESIWLHCKRGLKNCHVYSLWGVTQGQFQASKSLLPQSRSMDHWWPLFWPCTVFLGSCWSKHLTFKVQNAKPWSRKLVACSILKLLVAIWRKKMQMIFKKSFIVVTFDGSLVAFILALYSIFWGAVDENIWTSKFKMQNFDQGNLSQVQF